MTPMSPADPVRVERLESGLAFLTIDNPPLNLFSAEVLDGLASSLAELTASPPRALLLRGAGQLMSGGVDVAMFTTGGAAEFTSATRSTLAAIVAPLEALPCSTIAACHGLCLTAAFELALACDLILASRGAQLGLVEASLGLTPAMGGTQRLAAKAGLARATELVLTGKIYSAETLEGWGVINRVYDDDGFEAASFKFASRLAAGPTVAHAATKEVLRIFATGGVSAADERLPEISGALFDTEDLQHGIKSFLANGPGKATFHGR